MKKLFFAALPFLAGAAYAQATPAPLAVTLGSIENNHKIPEKYAYCVPDGKGKTQDGGNINPALSWSGAPAGTKSFTVLVVDKDVPASFELANKDGKTIPADFPRQDFYHWVLVDVPPKIHSIPEGKDSSGQHNRRGPGDTGYGISGVNSYAKMGKGLGGGYNGPCPPWNDARLHHYHFQVFALDVPTLNLHGNFTGQDAQKAMPGHVLAQGEAVGTFSNNAKLAK